MFFVRPTGHPHPWSEFDFRFFFLFAAEMGVLCVAFPFSSTQPYAGEPAVEDAGEILYTGLLKRWLDRFVAESSALR